MKPHLRDVTLCAADCHAPALAARALRLSLQACTFGDALLLTDAAWEDPAFRTVRIDRLASLDDYSRFVFKELAAHIHTPHVLLVQWDGHVVEPAAWREDFLAYDYIGARWTQFRDHLTVGNGGFSLRSRRLLQATAGEGFAWVPGAAEDVLVCRTYRPRLSAEMGMRFAPEAVARAFSYETEELLAPTFGFHGVLNLWRHVDDSDMLHMAAQLDARTLMSWQFVALVAQYAAMRKFRVAAHLHALLARHLAPPQVRQRLIEHLGSRQAGSACHEALLTLQAGPLGAALDGDAATAGGAGLR
jgi:hypothetical protein